MGETASPAAHLRSPLRLHDDLRRDGIGNAALVGRDPIDNVVMMEDHDGAYYAWKQAVQRQNIAPHRCPHRLGLDRRQRPASPCSSAEPRPDRIAAERALPLEPQGSQYR